MLFIVFTHQMYKLLFAKLRFSAIGFIALVLMSSLFSSCKPTNDLFEKTQLFSNFSWDSKQKLNFGFDISDTNAYYKIYFVFRHQDAYNFQNIWLDVAIQQPDTLVSIRRSFTLSDNTKWLGTSMDDIIEYRIPFSESGTKLKKGKYNFTLTNIMREDPLQHVLQAGIRIEKMK